MKRIIILTSLTIGMLNLTGCASGNKVKVAAVFVYGLASMGGSDSFYLNNADINGF